MHSIAENMRILEQIKKNRMKIDPYYHRLKCSPMTVVSADIRVMRIFAGIPWGVDVKRQWGCRLCRQRQFSAFSLAISSETFETRSALLYSSPSLAFQ